MLNTLPKLGQLKKKKCKMLDSSNTLPKLGQLKNIAKPWIVKNKLRKLKQFKYTAKTGTVESYCENKSTKEIILIIITLRKQRDGSNTRWKRTNNNKCISNAQNPSMIHVYRCVHMCTQRYRSNTQWKRTNNNNCISKLTRV